MRFAFIDKHKNQLPVERLCEVMDVTPRGYRAWKTRSLSERTVKYWFAGERRPSGDHLIALARNSDVVLYVFLALVDRHAEEEGG